MRFRLETQLKELRLGLHRNPVLQSAWRRYGPRAFNVCVFEDVHDLTRLREREQAWIEQLRTLYPYGFNRQPIRDPQMSR